MSIQNICQELESQREKDIIKEDFDRACQITHLIIQKQKEYSQLDPETVYMTFNKAASKSRIELLTFVHKMKGTNNIISILHYYQQKF